MPTKLYRMKEGGEKRELILFGREERGERRLLRGVWWASLLLAGPTGVELERRRRRRGRVPRGKERHLQGEPT